MILSQAMLSAGLHVSVSGLWIDGMGVYYHLWYHRAGLECHLQ